MKHCNLITGLKIKYEYVPSFAKYSFIIFICPLKYQCDFESMGLLQKMTTSQCSHRLFSPGLLFKTGFHVFGWKHFLLFYDTWKLFNFQCSCIMFYWNTATQIYLWTLCSYTHTVTAELSSCSGPCILQGPKHLQSLQKSSLSPAPAHTSFAPPPHLYVDIRFSNRMHKEDFKWAYS